MAKQTIESIARDSGYPLTQVHDLAWRLNTAYASQREASVAARRIGKRFFTRLATYTTDHDADGWHATVYPDTARARQFGLLG